MGPGNSVHIRGGVHLSEVFTMRGFTVGLLTMSSSKTADIAKHPHRCGVECQFIYIISVHFLKYHKIMIVKYVYPYAAEATFLQSKRTPRILKTI